jgi:Ca2+/Na+ antiporter
MVLPEFLGPWLTPEPGGIDWVRLGLTVLLAVGVIAGVRWIRWVTIALLVLGLLVGLVGSGIFSPPVQRIPYLVILALLYGFALYVLAFSDSADQFFSARSQLAAGAGDRAA